MNRTLFYCFLSALAGGVVSACLLGPRANWSLDQAASAQVPAPATTPSAGYSSRTITPPVAAQPSISLTAEEQTNIRVYEATNPSVVNINTKIESHSVLLPML